jgi:hypothetical protein
VRGAGAADLWERGRGRGGRSAMGTSPAVPVGLAAGWEDQEAQGHGSCRAASARLLLRLPSSVAMQP